MTYELIGTPRIENEYSDEYETVMVCDLKRSDGETGDVWIVAGVPDYQRGSSDACGSQRGYQSVRVFGDSVDMWCPESFRVADEDGRYETVMDAVVEACSVAALESHNDRRRAKSAAVEYVQSHSDDDKLDEGELREAFAGLYGRAPDANDERNGLWSLCCAGVESVEDDAQ